MQITTTKVRSFIRMHFVVESFLERTYPMISCITYDDLEYGGKLFVSQFKLRHKCFIERLNYNVSTHNGMEYDEYDNPSKTYLIYHNSSQEALGVSRLGPICKDFMIQDLWPNMLSEHIERTSDVWEGTRFCINKDLPSPLRKRISQELVLAYIELGLAKNIKKIIGVMPTLILNCIFKKAGCRFRTLGPVIRVDNDRVQAAEMEISWRQLRNVQKTTGINYSVLVKEKTYEQIKTAA